jgi:hypothetical protein
VERHLAAEIEYLRDELGGQDQVELRDAHGGCDRATLEIHLEIMYLRDALGGRDRSRLEEYLDVVNLEAVDRKGVVMAAETLFIG